MLEMILLTAFLRDSAFESLAKSELMKVQHHPWRHKLWLEGKLLVSIYENTELPSDLTVHYSTKECMNYYFFNVVLDIQCLMCKFDYCLPRLEVVHSSCIDEQQSSLVH